MKTLHSSWVIGIVAFLFLSGCASNTLQAATLTQPPPGKMETKLAATNYVNGTATALAEEDTRATMTAAVPQPTNTDVPTPTPNRFNFDLPASGCWVNSEISVHEGQTVIIRASGEINTWGGRDGSSGDPNGQKGICGAVQCPLQGVGYGALIGRLEDLPPFFVGSMVRYTAAKDGQLSFTVNDWECEDNRGSFAIQVTFP